MEILIQFFNYLGIEWPIVLLYICAGLLVKGYLPGDWKLPLSNRTVTTAWKTLMVGTVIVGIYVLIEHGSYYQIGRGDWKRIFFSYIFTTSFYELALKDTVADYIVNLLPKKRPQ